MKDEFPKRKEIRLKGYDYSQSGAYFVTICVKDRQHLFGKVVGTTALGRPYVELTPLGQCVADTIENANKGNVNIDKYTIMPNHLHMIVILNAQPDDRGRSSLQQVVRNIKSYVTKWAGYSFWQPRYYDHIVRDEADYRRIWEYIDNNPMQWEEDVYYEVSD